MALDRDLPDELLAEGADASEADSPEARLEALGIVIAGKRDEAVKARSESGIESVWMAAEEAYLCMDEANRSDFKNAKWAKPVSMEGPLTKDTPKSDETRSTAYVRMSARYVDAGASRVSEILLPINDKAFSFGPTPVPDLVAKVGDVAPLMQEGKQVYRPLAEGEQPREGAVNGMVLATVGDMAKVTMDKATEAAEKAETRIYDWMVECNYPAEARKIVFDAARIGVGVLKGPYPDMSRAQAMTKVEGGVKVSMVRKVKPVVRWVDPWNFFPAKGCGEDIHSGDYVVERDFLTERKLKELKRQKNADGAPIFLADQIDKVIKEGPGKCNAEGQNPSHQVSDKTYEVWYFTGTVTRRDMEAAKAIGLDDGQDPDEDMYAVITLVNSTVIRVNINPLDTGRFPYHVKPWSRRAGHWAGVGICEQVAMPQRMVNAATRALLNNAGLSSGVQIIVDQLKIVPADGKWVITPNKIWYTANGDTVDDVAKAFRAIEFPNQTDALMAIIQYAFKLAEEATNIPLITQGQTGPTTPDTFGATELQNNNANTFLRSQGYGFDDCITEPMVHQFYEYLLLDPSVPDDEKGDFQINARGSIAMVEKAIQEIFYVSLLGISKDPAFGVNPEKVMEEILKGKRIDARRVQYTEEEKQKMREAPPPEDPAITAAKIRAASAEKVAQGKDAVTLQKAKLDTDRDTAYEQALTQRAIVAEEGKGRELGLKRELEILKMTNAAKIELDKVKAQLAETRMELAVQRELAQMTAKAQQVADTDMEPVGRAEPGKAFQQ